MKISQNLSILFFANTPKKDATGKTPIYCRITVDGKRAQFSTGKKIDINKWVPKQGYVTNSHENAKTINYELDAIKNNLRKIFHQFLALNTPVTADTILTEYLGKNEKHKTFIDLFTQYINIIKHKSLLPKPQISPATVKSFKVTKKKVQEFLNYQFNSKDKLLTELKSGIGDDFHFYLTAIDQLSNNSAMKYMRITKQVLDYAVLKEDINKNPMKHFKCTYNPPNREYLSMTELIAIYEKELSIERIAQVRDVFVFGCYTGYAYQDTFQLSKDNIIIGIDGEKWLTKPRQKTETNETVPLLPIALEIIEKYKNHPYCIANNKLLPVNSNQRYNAYLKEVADVCGIKKNLTTHTARHTFATTVTLEHDVPIETVSQMLGHRSLRTTQIYAKITQKKMSNNMKELKLKLAPKTNDEIVLSKVQ